MGVQIQGDTGNVIATKGTYSGNVTIGGTLTYEDVTNIDSVGLITAREGIEVGASPGVGASISVDGNAIFSGITTATTLRAPTGIVTSLITNTARATTGIVTTLTATTGIVTTLTTNTLTANSTTKVGSGVTLSPDGDVFATGVCTATSFSGDGSALSNVSAGKVVKFGLASSTTIDQYGAQDTYTLVGPQLTFTGSSASNKLLLLHNHHMLIENASFWFMALFRDGTSGTKVHEKRWYSQDNQWIGHTGINHVVLDIPDSSSHTYQFAIYRTSGTNRLVYNYNNSNSAATENFCQIIALEIDPT